MKTRCEPGGTSATTEGEVVSDPDAKIDQLIQASSVPNLAALYRAAKQRGLIPPLFEYGQTV